MKLFFSLTLLISLQAAPVLAKTYDLEIKKQKVFITGKAVEAITVNNQIPAPTLNFKEGDVAEIRVKNSMDEKTSIHWHGILLPGNMDGVPGLNGFEGIAPGETFTYKFKIRQNGTYWYHSHSNLQEQRGIYGAMVIEPRNFKKDYDDQVIVLSDFHEENPQRIMDNLKLDSGYYNYSKRTFSTFIADVKKDGFFTAIDNYKMWGEMRMDPTDLSDVSRYTFLMNGEKELKFSAKKMRLRFINAGAMTFFDVAIPNLKMTLIAADGQDVKPVTINEFRIAPAETYDVIIEPNPKKSYALIAESIDRTGRVIAKIGDGEVELPKMRKRVLLNMKDMGMEMEEENRGWADADTPKDSKALSYADLISKTPQKDLREPTREIEFNFGGSMNRYIWTINGEKFPQPTHLKFGEKVRLKFTNDTMMAHPVHLHGMFMQLENGQSKKWMPNKHTIILLPGQTVSALLNVDEEGEWAMHCHLLFHMASGMMSSVTVERSANVY